MSEQWDPRVLPSLAGRTVVVTGASGGIGYFVTLQLAGAGAHVVLACRDPGRAEKAMGAIRGQLPDASLSFLELDTSSLASVAAAATALSSLAAIDALINNAALVFPPAERTLSVDGNELTLATNFLGHFALVARLLPLLERSSGRVVMTGSLATSLVAARVLREIELPNYRPGLAYARSKLATESFGFELARRLLAGGSRVAALVAHPGTATDVMAPPMPNGSTQAGHEDPVVRRFPALVHLLAFALQGKDSGAWPLVRAAVDTSLVSGSYVGPRWVTRGAPSLRHAPAGPADPRTGALFWEWGERATGCTIVVPRPAASV